PPSAPPASAPPSRTPGSRAKKSNEDAVCICQKKTPVIAAERTSGATCFGFIASSFFAPRGNANPRRVLGRRVVRGAAHPRRVGISIARQIPDAQSAFGDIVFSFFCT